MKRKLTLTLEQEVIVGAKKYAQQKGRSLSGLIEHYLLAILKEDSNHIKLPSYIKKLKGAIKLPNDFDYKKELSKLLVKKRRK